MNFYPNYNQLHKYFIDNFSDYNKFINKLESLTFNSELKVYDTKQQKFTDLNETYRSKKFLFGDNQIIDSYLNSYNIETNTLEISNYFEFPPYILYLFKDHPQPINISDAIKLLDLTRYIIFNNHDENDDEDEDDIEDSIYLKNRISEYKIIICELNENIKNKDKKNIDLQQIINDLKLKVRKANFNLMENQNIFTDLHHDIIERDQMIEKQNNRITEQNNRIIEQNNRIIEQNNRITELESSYIYGTLKQIYDIYDGFKIFFNRISLN
jgi:hypothetical protein